MIALHLTGVGLVRRDMVVRQQTRQIQLLLAWGVAGQTLQQINTPYQLLQVADAQLGHPLPGLGRDEPEEVHRHFNRALEVFLPQVLVLGRDAGGTVVQMTDTQVLTTQGHHWCGAETEAFGAQNSALDHIQAGLDTAIGLQADLAPQVVGAQRLLGFTQAQFPGRAGVTDRGQRAGRCTTVVAGNRNQVRVGFRHTGSDGAYPRLRYQFHRNQRTWIDLFEIEDQLRQILDRINIVVRWWRNQRHTGH